MRWPWKWRRGHDSAARRARQSSKRILAEQHEQAVQVIGEEQDRLDRVIAVTDRLDARNRRNNYTEQMRVAFGGQK